MKKIVLFLLILYYNNSYADNLPIDQIVEASIEPVSTNKEVAKPRIVIDKKEALLTIIYPNGTTKTTPVLTGLVKSDTLDMDVYNDPNKSVNWITPAGEYELKKVFSWRLNEPVITFIRGNHKMAGIHPLWMGNKDQRRPKRLKSETPTDNKITNGCVNIDPEFFYTVLNNDIPDGTKLTILPEM